MFGHGLARDKLAQCLIRANPLCVKGKITSCLLAPALREGIAGYPGRKDDEPNVNSLNTSSALLIFLIAKCNDMKDNRLSDSQ